MPRRVHHKPQPRYNRTSRRFYVTVDGRRTWLGRWQKAGDWKAGQPLPADVQQRYESATREWRPEVAPAEPAPKPASDLLDELLVTGGRLTVAELILAHWRWAKGRYVRDGRPTAEYARIRGALRVLNETVPDVLADSFNVGHLDRTRDAMVARGWKAKTIREYLRIIRRMFRWGGGRALVRPGIAAELLDLEPLAPGLAAALRSEPVECVPVATILRTLPHLNATLQGLIRFIAVTGCRPGEAVILRPCDAAGVIYPSSIRSTC